MTLRGVFSGQNSQGRLTLNSEDGTVVEYHCKFNPPLSIPFKGVATSGGDIGECYGSDEFSGVIGPNDFTLNFNNGLTILGVLNLPVPEEYSVNGHGNWTAN